MELRHKHFKQDDSSSMQRATGVGGKVLGRVSSDVLLQEKKAQVQMLSAASVKWNWAHKEVRELCGVRPELASLDETLTTTQPSTKVPSQS